MIIIPTGTDAPIYHRPYATASIIVINIALFFVVPPPAKIDPSVNAMVRPVHTNFDRYALTIGDGQHPVQWLTHSFLNRGWVHLGVNMIFLWVFGIVVEGKLVR